MPVVLLYVNDTLCHGILIHFNLASSDVIKNHCNAPKSPDGLLLTRLKMNDGVLIMNKNYAKTPFYHRQLLF